MLDWLQQEGQSWYMMADLRNLLSGIFSKAQKWELLPDSFANPMHRVRLPRKWEVRQKRILNRRVNCSCRPNCTTVYSPGYLGDMGTLPPYGVGDFAAWFEAYIGGDWYTFDPRNNVPRIGRVLMARGRDACDVAIATTFGPNTLESFKVWTDEAAESNGPV